MSKPYRHKAEFTCPNCGHVLTSSSNADEGAPSLPRKGDFSICIDCGRVLVYIGRNKGVRLPTQEELRIAARTPSLLNAKRAWAATKAVVG